MPDGPFGLKIYRKLLKLCPAGFREDYAALMEREFRDELSEARGTLGLAKLWIRLPCDLAKSIPLQIARELSQDSRHAFRLWDNRPLQITLAVAALAIGIGANIGVFSVVNALLLKSLPFRDADRLTALAFFIPPHDSASQFHGWARRASYLDDAAAFGDGDVNLGDAHGVLRTHTAQTTWNFFNVLGIQPVLGRTFSIGEDETGRNSVAVIGYGLWQELFAGDPRVIGSTIRIAGIPVAIIGVAPPGFDFPANASLWRSGGQANSPGVFSPRNGGWKTIARLKHGVGLSQARAAFLADANTLPMYRHKIRTMKDPPMMISLQEELAGPVKKASLLLMAGVGLLLLIACANVANLLLARTADRAAELSIRSALGASRARLMQQLFTECLLLSLVSAGVGFAVAIWTAVIATRVQPAPLTAQSYSVLDGRVLGFAVCISILSGVLFGTLSSFGAVSTHSFGVRTSSGKRKSRFIRETLVATQVMLTLVLLTASVSIGLAFYRLMRVNRGFKTKGLVTVSVSLDGTTRGISGRQLPYFEEALARVRRLPGVQSASATEFLPLYSIAFIGGPVALDNRPAKVNSDFIPVLAKYFRTMGGNILYGREFTDAEVRSDAKVAVVNEVFANQFGPPENALGHQVTLAGSTPRTIIGVVKGMDYMSEYISQFGDKDPPQVFVPAKSPGGFFSTFVVRVRDRAENQVAMIRDTIRSVDSQVPVFGAQTMEQRLNHALIRPKFYRTAGLFFAGFALLLTVIGIYGVVSYSVVQRMREMGICLALGATPTRLRQMLLRQGLLTILIGMICGIAGSSFSLRFLRSLVEGAGSINAITLGLSISLIVVIACASIWIGTRRIAVLNVSELLRLE